ALMADGARAPEMPWLKLGAGVAAMAALSPALAVLLHVPAAALSLIACQLLPSSAVALRRGGLLGEKRFGALGFCFLEECGVLFAAGTVLGLIGGATGLAAGLLLAPAVALTLTARASSATGARSRPVTSLTDTALALGLVTLFVNLDVLLAPAALGPRLS